MSNTEHNSTLATIERKKTTSITAKQLTAMYKESSPSVIKPTQSAELFITDQDDFAIATKNVEQGLVQEPIWHNAKQLKSVDPVYPSVAKRKGIEIEVKVNFTIDVNGQIKDIQFARQNKINYFKNSIRSAIEQWRFLPAKVDDQPVESQMSKVFAFSLQS